MQLLAFNGSPRKKKWNTATLLEHVVAGAQSAGAQAECIQLYDLNFSGCISCFSCKRRNRKQNGVCAVQDELTPLLDRIHNIDALVIGSPVYFGTETASTRAFLERLMYPFMNFDDRGKTYFPRSIPTGMIYTMNIPESRFAELGYGPQFEKTRTYLAHVFGSCEMLLSTDTLQHTNYDTYEYGMFDKDAKAKRHEDVFPQDCQHAYNLGRRLVTNT
ncbi:flavodoxin family protein [Desulfovibrio inopinatus]|uniref:flavodoxin family protein n=1 Tax=Desulfovibrio inopinatus TaxID=102109 RepID=UPI000407C6F6|nr:flavodoxin family protein [Desulfovibrio inopinatus]